MHLIEVDDGVYIELQRRAIPFEDVTPNDVLRRLLFAGRQQAAARNTQRPQARTSRPASPTRKSTAQRAYRPIILRLLLEHGGTCEAGVLLRELEERMRGSLLPEDYALRRNGEQRWRNSARWERVAMVHEGLIKKGTPVGVWELTDAGRELASKAP